MTLISIYTALVAQPQNVVKQNVDELIRLSRMTFSQVSKLGGESISSRVNTFSLLVPKSRLSPVAVSFDRLAEYTEPGRGEYKYDGDEIVGIRAKKFFVYTDGVILGFKGEWQPVLRKFGINPSKYGAKRFTSKLRPGYDKLEITELPPKKKGEFFDPSLVYYAYVPLQGTKTTCRITVWLDAGTDYPQLGRSFIQFSAFNERGTQRPIEEEVKKP